MDIGNQVTDVYQLKRGNYAVSNSDSASNDDAVCITELGTIASDNIRKTLIGYDRQERTCEADVSTGHNRQTTGSLCAKHSVQREPIQRGLLQQIERSTWSMAITLGQTRVVITETNTRSTQVCATSI
jgi:hypothetical protein